MWRLVRRVTKKTPSTARHHAQSVYAHQLIDTWSEQSNPSSLPPSIQYIHSLPTLHIVSSVYMLLSCNQMMMIFPSLSWSCVVLSPEAKRLSQAMMASPTLCRLLQQLPGNPLLHLYNLCLRDGCVPQAWFRHGLGLFPSPPAFVKSWNVSC